MFAVDTERLSIRPLCTRDQALYCELYTDPETMRFIGEPWSPELAARRFRARLAAAQRQPPRQLLFAMFEKPSQQPAGICGILRIDRKKRRAEAGIILRSSARARGFAKEGMRALIARAFLALPVDTIWVQIAADRPIFARKLNELGFVRDAGSAPIRGARIANRVWSIHRDSWQDTSKGGVAPC